MEIRSRDMLSAALYTANSPKGASTARRTERSPLGDIVQTSGLEGLRVALGELPEVRPEVVTRGRVLAKDSSYPTPTILTGMAKFFVADATSM